MHLGSGHNSFPLVAFPESPWNAGDMPGSETFSAELAVNASPSSFKLVWALLTHGTWNRGLLETFFPMGEISGTRSGPVEKWPGLVRLFYDLPSKAESPQ